MSKYLARVHVHLVWSTYRRKPSIAPSIEAAVHERMVTEAQRLRCHVLALGGMADHVHLLVWLHPACSVSELVRAAKVASCQVVRNKETPWFRWQNGYGAFAVQPRALDRVSAYVRSQPQHHARHTTLAVLEQSPGW